MWLNILDMLGVHVLPILLSFGVIFLDPVVNELISVPFNIWVKEFREIPLVGTGFAKVEINKTLFRWLAQPFLSLIRVVLLRQCYWSLRFSGHQHSCSRSASHTRIGCDELWIESFSLRTHRWHSLSAVSLETGVYWVWVIVLLISVVVHWPLAVYELLIIVIILFYHFRTVNVYFAALFHLLLSVSYVFFRDVQNFLHLLLLLFLST